LVDPASRSDCAGFLNLELELGNEAIVASLRDGKDLFLLDKARACLSAVLSLDCHDRVNTDSFCDFEGLFVPQVQEGGTCYSTFNCLGEESYCDRDECGGTCRRGLLLPGESCTNVYSRCDPDRGWCKYDGTSGTAICEAYLEIGADCANSSEGMCNYSTAFCDWNNRTCVARPRLGESCAMANCQEGLYCDTYTEPSSPTCKSLLGDGETCPSYGSCASSLYCDPNSYKCTSSKPSVGQSCTTYQSCVNSYCEGGTQTAPGICTEYKALNEPCTVFPDRCNSGLFCDEETLRCTPSKGLGEACVDNSEDRCKTFLICLDGVCEALPKTGEQCELDSPLPCTFLNRCDAGVCVPLQAVGEPCDSNADCISEWCDDSAGGVCSEECSYSPEVSPSAG
jgi:hypothetical protein